MTLSPPVLFSAGPLSNVTTSTSRSQAVPSRRHPGTWQNRKLHLVGTRCAGNLRHCLNRQNNLMRLRRRARPLMQVHPIPIAILITGSLILASCQASEDELKVEPDTAQQDRAEIQTTRYSDATELLKDLRSALESEGIRPCDIATASRNNPYSRRIPNHDAAICRFQNGARIFTLIVPSGHQTYRRYFSTASGPNAYFYGASSLLIAPNNTPRPALEALRGIFSSERS